MYAQDALRQLYKRIAAGQIDGCSLDHLESMTGLELTDDNGLRDTLPRITTFLNRLLALRVSMQNIIFAVFEELIEARVEGAKAAGLYDVGSDAARGRSCGASTGARSTRIPPLARKPSSSPSPSATAMRP